MSDRAHVVMALDVNVPLASGRLEGIAGARLVTGHVSPNPALGLALGLSVCARERWYNPALGIELEARTPYHSNSRSPLPDSLVRAYEARNTSNVVFARVVVEAARASWRRWFVAAGALRFGTALGPELGRRLQLGVSFLELGYTP